MIASIDISSTAEGFIRYNEKKVFADNATLIHNTTMEEKTQSKIDVMAETVAINSTVHKNKAAHIFISLPKEEHISDQKFVELADDYLKGMGFENSPVLIYRHFDRGHDHIHIVVPTVNFDGQYNKRLNGFYKKDSQKLSRELEIKHNLVQNLGKGTENTKSLNEINASKFKIAKAILKASNDPVHKSKVEVVPGAADFLIAVKLNPEITNNYVEKFFREKGAKEEFKELVTYLNNNDLVYKTNKEVLIDKLEGIYSKSTDKDNFLKNVEENNIYVANIHSGLKYGLGEKSYYITEKNLPKKFTADGLTYFGQVVADKKEQIAYISKMVNKALPKSSSVEAFVLNMQLNGIEVKLDRNTGGIYGISFKSEKVANAEFIKGSDVHRSMSWNNINQNLKINETNAKEFKPVETEYKDKKTAETKVETPNTKKLENDIGQNSDAEARRIKKLLGKIKGEDQGM